MNLIDLTELVVPIEKRSLTGVQRSFGEIAKLQKDCEHDFKYLTPPDLKESLVAGVFIGGSASGYVELEACCLKCSKLILFHPHKTCPRCFKPMNDFKAAEQHGNWKHLEDRLKYRSKNLGYYVAVVHSCPNCHLQVVVDQWDQ